MKMGNADNRVGKVPGDLLEQLAEKVHETWMARRLSEGWKYGERRDDAAKTHPCLMPYDQLPDSEKEYDRATAAETMRMIQELGYEIVRRDEKEEL